MNSKENLCGLIRKNSINDCDNVNDNNNNNNNDSEYLCRKKRKYYDNSTEQFTSTEELERSRSSSVTNSYSPLRSKPQTLRKNKNNGLYGSFGNQLEDNKDINNYIINEVDKIVNNAHEQQIDQKNDTDDEGWGFYT